MSTATTGMPGPSTSVRICRSSSRPRPRSTASGQSDNLAPCVGEGNIEFIGNGLTDPVGIAAMVMLGGGLVGLLFNARPAMTYRK